MTTIDRSRTSSVEERRERQERAVLGKVVIDDGCWLWDAALDGRGYGACWYRDRVTKAHRAVYEIVVGPIADGLVIDHLCRNPRCVRPSHLEPVLHSENVKRGESGAPRRTTHCKRGHEFTAHTTGFNARGYRFCKTCAADLRRARRKDDGRVKKVGVRVTPKPVGTGRPETTWWFA